MNRVVADNAVPIGLVERSANLVEVTAGRVLGQFGTGFGGGFMLKVVPEPLQESLIDLFKGQFRQAMVAVQVMTGGDPDRMVGFASGSFRLCQRICKENLEREGIRCPTSFRNSAASRKNLRTKNW